jgi:hypothetical protein
MGVLKSAGNKKGNLATSVCCVATFLKAHFSYGMPPALKNIALKTNYDRHQRNKRTLLMETKPALMQFKMFLPIFIHYIS